MLHATVLDHSWPNRVGRNIMQHGGQTHATCCVQQCCTNMLHPFGLALSYPIPLALPPQPPWCRFEATLLYCIWLFDHLQNDILFLGLCVWDCKFNELSSSYGRHTIYSIHDLAHTNLCHSVQINHFNEELAKMRQNVKGMQVACRLEDPDEFLKVKRQTEELGGFLREIKTVTKVRTLATERRRGEWCLVVGERFLEPEGSWAPCVSSFCHLMRRSQVGGSSRNITSHSMKNMAFHSWIRWKWLY